LKKRRELHLKIAKRIEKLYRERLEGYYELLGYHYEKAESWLKAAEYFDKAEKKAEKLKKGGHLMDEKKKDKLRLQFDRHIQLEFHPAKVTSDAGLLAYRELDDALGLTDMASAFLWGLKETRTGRNIQHQQMAQMALLRQSVYSRLAGYEDINDAQRLRIDPAMRTVVSRRAIEKQDASTNTVFVLFQPVWRL